MDDTKAPPPMADLVATLISEIRRLAAAPPRVERLAYSVDETAAALGRTRRVVEGLIDSGELRAKMVGRQLAIPRTELERFLGR
jgi:excisionase family DNA binding protein